MTKEAWEKELERHDGDVRSTAEILSEAQMSLIAAAIGSCTCLTKSPVLAHHDADCRYLKISNALEAIESLQARHHRS